MGQFSLLQLTGVMSVVVKVMPKKKQSQTLVAFVVVVLKFNMENQPIASPTENYFISSVESKRYGR